MTELWLKYIDERGDAKRVSMRDEIFVIGRHPENDLCIADNRLSREHIRIERYAGNFYVSDSNSSNGSTLNGAPLRSSVALKNGDRLNLGDAIEIQIEITDGNNYQSTAFENSSTANTENFYSPSVETPPSVPAKQTSAASNPNQIPKAIFLIVPIFGIFILIFVVGFIYLLSGKKEVAATNDDIPIYTPRTTPSDDSTDEKPTPRKSGSNANSDNQNSSTSDSNDSPISPPKISADAEKVEQNAASFLRRIAQNDPKAFLTGKQSEIVNSKISQFKNSSALADNLKAVKKNESQFISLATSKNLKPQFLATAALAKIGNNRGDPLAVATTMLPVLSELKITLDNKLADDNLLIIAAYERGAAGNPRSLQSALEAIAKNAQNVSPREIRTIWFLHDKGKISDAEFNFALQFIAIGAITQNPKDFNVSADALTFN